MDDTLLPFGGSEAAMWSKVARDARQGYWIPFPSTILM
jgi:hypothetical protein